MGTPKCTQQHAHAVDSGVEGGAESTWSTVGQKVDWGPPVIDTSS